MEDSHSHVRFASTRGSLLEEIRSDSPQRSAAALEELTTLYWPPVYGFVRRLGHRRADASDIVQSFFADVVIGRRLFHSADAARGRLRTLLLAALRNHMVDLHRRQRVRGKAEVGRAESARALAGTTPLEDAEAIYERRWARCVVGEAARRTARRFEIRGQSRAWQAFEWTKLRADAGRIGTPSGEVVARELGYRCAADVAEANRAVRRELLNCLQEVVTETIAGDAAAAVEELQHIRGLLR